LVPELGAQPFENLPAERLELAADRGVVPPFVEPGQDQVLDGTGVATVVLDRVPAVSVQRASADLVDIQPRPKVATAEAALVIFGIPVLLAEIANRPRITS
jgi:hypothetical protein